jgi:hypothetical protein
MKTIATAGALAMLLCGPAMAEGSDWSYAATLYGWTPALGTEVVTAFGTVDADLSISDALSTSISPSWGFSRPATARGRSLSMASIRICR